MNGARLFRIRFPRQARGTTCIPSGLVYAAPDAVTTIRNDGAPISSASIMSLRLIRFSAPLSAHASVSLIPVWIQDSETELMAPSDGFS